MINKTIFNNLVQNKEPVTIDRVKEVYRQRGDEIRHRLSEFKSVWENASDNELLEELVFCIFTANASARMGLRSVAAIKSLLKESVSAEEFSSALNGVHRFPNARGAYVATTIQFLQKDCQMRLRERLLSFPNSIERREWLVREKGIKGLGYKEASHFLRNIGFSGLAILDKHILNCLAEMGFIKEAKAPATKTRYLEIEVKMRQFAELVNIDFDELDLVLWSLKTGEVLK